MSFWIFALKLKTIYRYQYDGNGRLAVMLSAIGSGNDHQQTDTYSYNAHTGALESLSGFRLSKLSYNKTYITDAEDNFYKSYEFDGLGRISKVRIWIDIFQHFEQFRAFRTKKVEQNYLFK